MTVAHIPNGLSVACALTMQAGRARAGHRRRSKGRCRSPDGCSGASGGALTRIRIIAPSGCCTSTAAAPFAFAARIARAMLAWVMYAGRRPILPL